MAIIIVISTKPQELTQQLCPRGVVGNVVLYLASTYVLL